MIVIEPVQAEHILEIKILADTNRDSIGFNTRKKFEEVVTQNRGIVALHNDEVIGFVIFRHRKIDDQTTLSEICIDQRYRGQGIGEQLMTALVQECQQKSRRFIQLKCPVDLPANNFYKRNGFELVVTEKGKKRSLNVWRLFISSPIEDEA